MSQRKCSVRYPSEEVQGEGSYIALSPMKVKEIRKLRKDSKADEDFDFFEKGLELLATRVLDWNWVDDEGKPLTKPSEDSSIIDELTEAEATFIVDKLLGSDEVKN